MASMRTSGPAVGRYGIFLLLMLLMASAGAPVASAVTLQDAESLYAAGNYRAAALAGQSLGTADGLAVAVRARLVRAAYLLPFERGKAELYQAQALADQVLAKNPNQPEALLDMAIILGYRARIEGYVGAFFDGLAKKARRLIRHAEKLEPESAWARAVDAGWNAEIVVGAGPGLAKSLYGATRDKALGLYRQAVALDPTNPTIRLEYAKAIIKLQGKGGWADAVRQLDKALAGRVKNTFADLMQDQARSLKAALQSGNADIVAERLVQIDPFSQR